MYIYIYMYIGVYWEIFDRKYKYLVHWNPILLISFLAFHRLFSIILEKVWNFFGSFSGLAQIFFENVWFFWESFEKPMEYFEKQTEHFEKQMELFEKQMEHFEKNRRFWEQWNILRKIRLFLRNFDFLGIFPFTLVFALLFAIWTFWEKMEHFEKNPGIFEKNPGTFEKNPGQKKKLW